MSDAQETILLTMLLKPIVLAILFFGIMLPARVAVERFMKDGKLKRFLLYRVNRS